MESLATLLAKGHPSSTLSSLHTLHLASPHDIALRINCSITCLLLHQFHKVTTTYLLPGVVEKVGNPEERMVAELVVALARLHRELDVEGALRRVGEVGVAAWIDRGVGGEYYGLILTLYASILSLTNTAFDSTIVERHFNHLLNQNQLDALSLLHSLLNLLPASAAFLWRYESLRALINARREGIETSSSPAVEDQKLAYDNLLRVELMVGLLGKGVDVEGRFEGVDVVEGIECARPMVEKRGMGLSWRDLLANLLAEGDRKKVRTVMERFAGEGDWRGVDACAGVVEKEEESVVLMRAGVWGGAGEEVGWAKKCLQARGSEGSRLMFWRDVAGKIEGMEVGVAKKLAKKLAKKFYETVGVGCSVWEVSYRMTIPLVSSLPWARQLLSHAALSGRTDWIENALQMLSQYTNSSTRGYSALSQRVLGDLYTHFVNTSQSIQQFETALELSIITLREELKAGAPRPNGLPWSQTCRDILPSLSNEKHARLRLELALAKAYLKSEDPEVVGVGRGWLEFLLGSCSSVAENAIKAECLLVKGRLMMRDEINAAHEAFVTAESLLDGREKARAEVALAELLFVKGEFGQSLESAERALILWGGLMELEGVESLIESVVGAAGGLGRADVCWSWVRREASRRRESARAYPRIEMEGETDARDVKMEEGAEDGVVYAHWLKSGERIWLLTRRGEEAARMFLLTLTVSDVELWLGNRGVGLGVLKDLVSPLSDEGVSMEGDLVVLCPIVEIEDVPIHALMLADGRVLGERNSVVYGDARGDSGDVTDGEVGLMPVFFV